MKVIMIAIGIMFLGIDSFAQHTPSKTNKDFQSLHWIEGSWQRLNMRTGRAAFETWRKQNNEFVGRGITLKETDTVFIEKIKIVIVNNEIHYVADVPENPQPVHFRFTTVTSNSFVCENPKHDYPKKISYELKGDTLKAITSGDGKQQKFFFVRSK